MSDAVQQIKERLSIFDVVSQYVQLQKAGRHYKGKSPFSNERTPSFFVSPDRGMYYCFSSHKGGDIFTFIEEMEGVDFKGALKILAERANVELVREDPKKRSERDDLYAILEAAAVFFETELKNDTAVQQYIRDRGVTDTTIKQWRIGYVPEGWRTLKHHLVERGFSEHMILRAGLIKKADAGKESYDVFRGRVMFPICDASGRIVAFSGRAAPKSGALDPNTPKYVNSPETELYQKSETLFGYDKAKQGIRSMDFSLIVEGQFDLVLAHQVGYRNTVAISGTALTKHHLGLLARLSNNAVLALDADPAGVLSIKRGARLMLAHGMDVKVVGLEEGDDPADVAQRDPKLLKQTVGQSVHVVEFLLTALKRESKDERTYKLRVREEILPLIVVMPNRIDREHFEEVIGGALKTTKDAIHYEVERLTASTEGQDTVSGTERPVQTEEKKQSFSRTTDITMHLLGILLWQKELTDRSIDVDRLEQALLRILGEDTYDALLSSSSDEKNRVMFEAEALYEGEGEAARLDAVLRDRLTELRARSLKVQLKNARDALREAEAVGDVAGIDRCLEECSLLQKFLAGTDGSDPFLERTEEKGS